jgi:hypothetical protein
MTAPLNCEALRDDIIALLYDDGELAERSRARDHLAACVPCRMEYADLKGVRKTLGGWTLPVAASIPAPRGLAYRFPPGLVAAAGIVLGIGLAVAGRSVFSPAPSSSTIVAESAPSSSQQAPLVSAAAPQFVSYDELQNILKSQESRYQAEIADLRQTLTQVAESSAPQAAGARAVSSLSPATVERLLKASEERQARMFEARLAGLRTESDLQRQYDMAQIAAGLAYIDSRTGADAARTSELMKNLVRVTAKPQGR